MKGKKVFFISALLGALGLVGGTFAAWAVTDNANPFQVNITPGTLDVGTDKAVTLDWGTKGSVDIENLEMGQRKGPYEVGLIATTSDASSFTGSLSVSLTTTATGTTKLIDYLTVKVYEAAAGTGDAWLTVPDGSQNYTIAKDLIVTSGTEKSMFFFIELASGINPTIYNTIKTDVVTLTVDWNKGSAIDVITSVTYYFNKPNEWGNDIRAYAWKAADGSSNAEWPGIAMKQEKGSIYSVAIPTGFDKVIFNDAEGTHQTADLTLPGIATPYYDGTNWVAAPDISAETVYYLVGTFNGWVAGSTYTLVAASGTEDGDKFTYTHKIENVNVGAGDELKIVSSENNWYAENIGSDANMQIGEANHYDFFFNAAGSDGRHIFCKAHA